MFCRESYASETIRFGQFPIVVWYYFDHENPIAKGELVNFVIFSHLTVTSVGLQNV